MLAALVLTMATSSVALAQMPQTMSYQGVLTDGAGNLVADGSYSVTFRIYSLAVGGSALWTETQPTVAVTKGGFSVLLGSVTPISLPFNVPYWLGVSVNGGAELSPRVALSSSPYAFHADTALFAQQVAAGAGGLTLPFSGSGSTSGDVFSITNTGTGNAGRFTIDNATSTESSAAIFATNNSTAPQCRGIISEITAPTTPSGAVAIWGRMTGSGNFGIGVAGTGNDEGVSGSGANHGVAGQVLDPGVNSAGVIGFIPVSTNGLGFGVDGTHVNGTAIRGHTAGGRDTIFGVWGILENPTSGPNSAGLRGENRATNANGYGIYGSHAGGGVGVAGVSNTGIGVFAKSSSSAAAARAIHAEIEVGSGTNSSAIYGENKGATPTSMGVLGIHDGPGYGVFGQSNGLGGVGTYGFSPSGTGIFGQTTSGNAGRFSGNVTITGNLSVSGSVSKGSGSFKIDHPLDPANEYLSHSFVESPDMMNVYNGNIVLDEHGEATVELPNYFEALNGDFRYQLTSIGAPGPNLYVASEVHDHQFKIAGGAPSSKVSWQVTGIRHDAVALAHPIKVEERKPAGERGRYLDPQAFGQPAEKAIGYVPPPAGQKTELAKEVR